MRPLIQTLLATLTLAALPLQAPAQSEFPDRTIRMVVPFPPGGPTDIVARLVAVHMTTTLGQNVVVENRAGATGTIGSLVVAKSPPDGYTIVMGTLGSHTLAPLLQATMPYDPRKDFAPVSLLATVPNVLMVANSVPAKDVRELIALMKANPGKLNYGSAGNGSPLHLSGVLFQKLAGVDAVHVPYKGSNPALQDLRSGRIEFMFDAIPSALALVTSGAVRGLAVTGTKRVATLKDLPTMRESGVPDFESYTWNALFAPPGTPAPIIAKLNAAAVEAVRNPEIQKRLAEFGAEIAGSTPQELGELVAREMRTWGPAVEASGAKEK
jgi:tripartite-type tricarboxylate transporter receptor subunit TctC